MSVREKNDRWEIRFTQPGFPPVRISTGLAVTGPNGKQVNKAKALALESAARAAQIAGRLGVRQTVHAAFAEAVSAFMAHREHSGCAASSALRTRASLASAVAFWGQRPIGGITSGDIDGYKLWRSREHRVKQVTLRSDLVALSMLFDWAVRSNYCEKNPVDDVSRPSARDAKREHILSPDEEAAYFAHAKGALRDIARLMLLQGCRPVELLNLRKADVNLMTGHITIRRSKTAAGQRVLRLTEESALILAHRLTGDSEWVFAGRDPKEHLSYFSLHERHERALALCGGAFVLYDLRHTFASRAIQSGMNIMELARIMGHTSIQITQRYVHLSQSDMDRAMDRMDQANNGPTSGRADSVTASRLTSQAVIPPIATH